MGTTSFFARGTLRTPDVLTALLHAVTAETTTLQPSNSTVGCTPSGADEIQKPMLNVALTLKRSTVRVGYGSWDLWRNARREEIRELQLAVPASPCALTCGTHDAYA